MPPDNSNHNNNTTNNDDDDKDDKLLLRKTCRMAVYRQKLAKDALQLGAETLCDFYNSK